MKAGWVFEPEEEIVPGRYALKWLGGGSRYDVYLAHDERLAALVVAKLLRPERIGDDRSRAALAVEAALLRRLAHPSLVRCFGVDLSRTRPHLVLEHIEGPTLASLLRRYGPLPVEQLLPLALQLCSVLHYLRAEGVVHLDVKPGNVIMSGPPRIIDLSVARTESDAGLLNHPVGTDTYMSPEQCAPTLETPPSCASDMWALGALLWEAVAGAPLFAPVPDRRYPQLSGALPMLPTDLRPPLLAEVIGGCLQRDPAARPTPSEVSESLEPLVAALPRRHVLGRLRPKLR